MMRALRWTLIGLGGVLGLLLIVSAAGLLWLGSESGRGWLTATANSALASPDQQVTLTGLSGGLPWHWRVERIDIADRDGIWLTIRDTALDLDGWALLHGTARIETLAAAAIDIQRAPVPPQTPAPASAQPFGLPKLPLGIELDRLAIARINVAPALAGEGAVMALAGDARLRAGTGRVRLQLDRIDGTGGRANLRAAYGVEGGAPDALDLSLHVEELSGALLSQALPSGEKLPLTIDLGGQGTLAAWRGKLSLAVGTAAHAGADLTIGQGAGDTSLSSTGDAAIAALLPAELRPIIGEDARFALAVRIAAAGPIGLDQADLTIAAGTAHAAGRYDPKSGDIVFRLDTSDTLASFQALTGEALGGQADLAITASGTLDHPSATLTAKIADLAEDGFGAHAVAADFALSPGASDRLHLTGSGHAEGLTNQGAAPPAGLDDALRWSFDLDTDRQAQHVALAKATLTGSDIDIDASGKLDAAALSGHAKILAQNLQRFAGLAGLDLKGGVEIEADAASADGKSVEAGLSGHLDNFGLGIPAVDAALGGTVNVTAKARRDGAGRIDLSVLKLDGAHAALDGSGGFNQAADTVQGHIQLVLPGLAPIGKALGTPLDGALTVIADGSGPSQDPHLNIALTGDRIVLGTARLDTVKANVTTDKLSGRTATIAARLGAGQIEAVLAATVAQNAQGMIAIRDLALTGPGTRVTGSASYTPATRRADGKLDANVEDLAAWSPLIGEKLTGHLTLSAELADLLGRPSGKLALDAAKLGIPGTVMIEAAKLRAQADRTGGIGFSLSTGGNAAGKSFSVASTGRLALPASGQELTLATLEGKVETLGFSLGHPLSATRRGAAMTASGLDLAIGTGRITGAASYDGRTMSLALKSDKLAIAPVLKLAGAKDIAGTLAVDLNLAGPVAGPKGHAVASLTDLKLAAATHPELPALRLDVSADLAPDAITAQGRVEGPQDIAALGFSGAVPIAWNGGAVALRQDGSVRAKLEGQGRLDTLSELAPIGEDRLSGFFGIDLAVSGTMAVPEAGGTLTITKGEYDNGLTGMTLRNIAVTLEGSRQAFIIRQFETGDGGAGRLNVDGKVDLAAAGGPALDINAKLQSFLVARRDEITATLGGDAHIGGALNAPQVKVRLALQRADINIPDKLPSSVPQLTVIRIDSSRPPPAAKPAEAPGAPPIVAALDVRLHVPGQVFVRGRGLDSEWRGDLTVGGSSAFPEITGEFDAVTGSFALLGTSFSIQHGILTFTGGTMPGLDMLAQAQTADITAQVLIQGLPTQPTLKLTSTPALPQDEILSRVLFGTSVGQITPTQGLQLAQAAASLAGGGPGLLDRLRTASGLDRLSVGQAAGVSGTAATTVSGGKYVAPGVFVGVDQGVSGTSTRAKVELSVTPHITLNATAGAASSSSSLGIQYKLDY
jgi:translocation and assembly module TamB